MKASKFLLAGAVVALLPFAANAQSPTQSPAPATTPESSAPAQGTQPARQGVTFESLDADSDGRISKTEAAANQTVSDQFSRYDKNGDGFIEREEVGGSSQSQPGSQPPK